MIERVSPKTGLYACPAAALISAEVLKVLADGPGPHQQQGFRSAPLQQFGFGGSPATTSSYLQPQNGFDSRKRGTKLRAVSDLPDVFRSMWKFGVFNAVQSTCFDAFYHSNQNVVVSAPTSSGKTVLFELAILRLFSKPDSRDVKVVYMAPTKSLCAERAADWKAKFERSGLGWTVAELTGDTAADGPGLWSEVNNARVIITTPEKWDSITRKWHDHHRSLALLRLFCIDECHSVGMDVRGATLEAVVSRMKTMGTDTRFIALSATVPNAQDVAAWLHEPDGTLAKTFTFGDEYRPCQLQKIVVGYPPRDNDFSFDSALVYKVFELIQSVLVFSNTRKGCVKLAEQLAKEYRQLVESPARRKDAPWPKPPRSVHRTSDKKLPGLLECGIAYHHAGLDMDDRKLVERLLVSGAISVVCSTSTLAVGVNLPARMVIVKGTKQFRDGRMFEYSDTEVLQMLGRAGRPQFDTMGVACVMTQKDQVRHYEMLANSQAVLESCLHKNLTEHINSEIMLRTINSVTSALRWLHSTFLYVRISKNPSYYALAKEPNKTADARLEEICIEAVAELAKNGIVEENRETIYGTPYCEMMAKFYLSQPTFVALKNLPLKANMRTLLETMSKAGEFSGIRIRAGTEKTVLTKANKMIRFPAPKVVTSTEKVFVLIQIVLEGITTELKSADVSNPLSEESLIFPHALRIAKCMVDLALERRDGGIKTAIELMRAISARAWDNSTASLRQIGGVGEKYSQVLSDKGIKSIAELRETDPGRIELITNRHPPFGNKVVALARAFPQLKIELEPKEEEVVETGVKVHVHIEIGLKVTQPEPIVKKGGMPLSAMVTLVSSDGKYVEFRKLRLSKLLEAKRQAFSVSVILVKPSQRIIGSVAVDAIAGSEVKAVLKPSTHASEYPVPASAPSSETKGPEDQHEDTMLDIEDDEPAAGGDIDMDHDPEEANARSEPSRPKPASTGRGLMATSKSAPKETVRSRRPDGKYECGHACGDKTKCRHLCCREGLDKPSRPTLKKRKNDDNQFEQSVAVPSHYKSSAKAKQAPAVKVTAPSLAKKDTLFDFFPPTKSTPRKKARSDDSPGFDSDSSELPPLDALIKAASTYDFPSATQNKKSESAKTTVTSRPAARKKRASTTLEIPSLSSPSDDSFSSSPIRVVEPAAPSAGKRVPLKKMQLIQKANRRVDEDEIDELEGDSDLELPIPGPLTFTSKRVRPDDEEEEDEMPSKYFIIDRGGKNPASRTTIREDESEVVLSSSSSPHPTRRGSPLFPPPSTSPRVPDEPNPLEMNDSSIKSIRTSVQVSTGEPEQEQDVVAAGAFEEQESEDEMDRWLRENVKIVPS